MLKSHNVIVIHLRVGIGIKCLTVSDLLLKSSLLVDRIVKLGESVTELGSVDEVLKSLGECGICRLTLCERRVLNGIIVNKGRLNEVLLNESVEELNEYRALGGDLGKLYVLLLSDCDS